MKKGTCFITGKQLPLLLLYQGKDIRENIRSMIKKDYPNFSDIDYISIDVLASYRQKYLEKMLEAEVGELSVLEKDVLNAIASEQLMVEI